MSRKRGSLAPLLVLLVFCGVWIAHTLEYLRVEGTYALRDEMTGSIHAYMLPVAGVLAGLAALAGARLWAAWVAAGSRLERARVALVAALRNRDARWSPGSAMPAPGFASGLVLLWIPLAVAQLTLYVVQENVEQAAAGAPTTGLGVISGADAPALWIHLGVALVLATLATVLARRLRERAGAAARTERLVAALVAHLRRHLPRAIAPASRSASNPLDQLGPVIWRRPPPRALFA